MIQVNGRPPMYDRIVAAFPDAARPGVVFSWEKYIYVPGGGSLPISIVAHEEAHGREQAGIVEKWWVRYIEEPAFRLEQEVIGHRAEYRELLRGGSRRDYGAYLKYVSGKLAAPLYGGLVTPAEAAKLVAGPYFILAKGKTAEAV